jgi:hypothetical protein
LKVYSKYTHTHTTQLSNELNLDIKQEEKEVEAVYTSKKNIHSVGPPHSI